MTLSSALRRTSPGALLAASLLGASLLVGGSPGAAVLAADEEASAAESEASPAAATIAPSPTPYPEFDPGAFTLRTDLFADGLVEPVYITDDGVPTKSCLYVVERGGQIRIVNSAGNVAPKSFLDISKRVNSDGPQQGLLGLAFHPDFANNGRYFVHYTDKNDSSIIAEYKGTPCKAGGSAKPVRTLFTVKQDYPNNNAGWIGFGPDRMLYIPLGDGGGLAPGDPDGVGQTPQNRLSKVLRADVSRNDLIALDNPYVRKDKNGKPKKSDDFVMETWAWGLRDPRRASFDRDTGDFWIGDVGQLQSEVNLVPAGSVDKKSGAPNFGWSDMEGFDCYENAPDCDPAEYVPPVYAYDQVSPQQAITGGYVYRGAMKELEGVYLFSDFRSGIVWGLDAGAVYAGFEPTVQQLLDAPQGFVSFGEDDAGELYLVSLRAGSIYRLSTDAR